MFLAVFFFLKTLLYNQSLDIKLIAFGVFGHKSSVSDIIYGVDVFE